MKLPFGFQVSRARPATSPVVADIHKANNLVSSAQPATGRWWRIWDNYAGQWQQDVSVELDSVLTFGAVFACLRLISTDIGKLRIKLLYQTDDEIWEEFETPAFSPVLRKPNPYQTRIKFLEQWVLCKLIHGRAYALKTRDARGMVVELRMLDPLLVEPLIAESGAVYYRICAGNQLSVVAANEDIVVPAREIIHDVYMTPEHPLIGVSPIGACGLAATQGLKIQQNSTKFFANQSRAGIVLSAPGPISNDTASRLKAAWETNYGGENYGRTAVLGDGLEPKTFTLSAEDSQLVDQLGWTAEDVCRCYGVPAYKIGVGPMPAFNNVEALDQAYYSQTLQELIECIELLLDEGLELPTGYCTELDLDGLLRMDTMTQAKVNGEEIKAGYLKPNEARKRRNLAPAEGGDSPMMQQQNYSLAALAKRDAKEDPFASAKPAAVPGGAQPGDPAADPTPEDQAAADQAASDAAKEVEDWVMAMVKAEAA